MIAQQPIMRTSSVKSRQQRDHRRKQKGADHGHRRADPGIFPGALATQRAREMMQAQNEDRGRHDARDEKGQEQLRHHRGSNAGLVPPLM